MVKAALAKSVVTFSGIAAACVMFFLSRTTQVYAQSFGCYGADTSCSVKIGTTGYCASYTGGPSGHYCTCVYQASGLGTCGISVCDSGTTACQM